MTGSDMAAIVARLEQLEGERKRELESKRVLEGTLGEAPKQTGANAARQAAQMAAVEARRRADKEFQAAYDAKLAQTEGERKKLRGELADINERVGVEQARHAQAMAKLQGDISKLNSRLVPLEQPPERPAPDYSQSNKMFVDGLPVYAGEVPVSVDEFAARIRRAA